MLFTPLVVTLCAVILCVLVARAVFVVWKERKTTVRGSEPGQGHHVIHAEYSSGVSGHHTTYKIPRDPDAYAKVFVPKNNGTQNDR